MISEKMKPFTSGSSAIRAMFEEGKRLATIYGKENVYDFSLGNPSVPAPSSVTEAIVDIAKNTDPCFLHGYTSNSGYEDVREALADTINKKYVTKFSLSNFILTTGAAAALNIIFRCILDNGDEVIAFAPFFGEYKNYVSLYDGKLVTVKPDYNTFMPDMDDFESKINEKTRAVIINSPNNPTGVIYPEETIIKISGIMDTAQKKYGKPIYLISDEPYRQLVYTGADVPFVTKYYDNSFVAYSYSKALSLPGERIGYVLVNNTIDGYDEMINALTVANRIMGFVNAPSLMQRVIGVCMDETADLEVYEKNRNRLYDMLTSLGFEMAMPDGAFYMFPKSLIEDDVEFCTAAKEFRLLLVPGSTFGTPGYFRIAYCVSPETIENSYESFKKLTLKYRGETK
ncbi:MAG: pyridoxal phosphate-dependent aminotransferase [Lachnospiraceae bacterium]|nr:pyridoxal phosphate-dependent aminotransferase [Lachnospiraceae bacterium]